MVSQKFVSWYFVGLLLGMCLSGGGLWAQTEPDYHSLRQAAAHGDTEAMLRLSEAYRFGTLGAAPNPDSANHFLRRAAQAGNPDALYLLGIARLRGLGMEQQVPEGIAALKRAGEEGNVLAWETLVQVYDKPITQFGRLPVPVDPAKAVRYARKAAQLRSREGTRYLAEAYFSGRGVPQSDSLTVAWYTTGAEQLYDPASQVALGDIFLWSKTKYGQRLKTAHYYYNLAVENPKSSLDQRTAGKIGRHNARKYHRKYFDVQLLLAFPNPRLAPQLYIRQ